LFIAVLHIVHSLPERHGHVFKYKYGQTICVKLIKCTEHAEINFSDRQEGLMALSLIAFKNSGNNDTYQYQTSLTMAVQHDNDVHKPTH